MHPSNIVNKQSCVLRLIIWYLKHLCIILFAGKPTSAIYYENYIWKKKKKIWLIILTIPKKGMKSTQKMGSVVKIWNTWVQVMKLNDCAWNEKRKKISAYLVCVDPTLGNQIKTHKKLNMTLFFFFIGQCKTECKFSGKMTQCTGQTDGEIEWKKRCNLVYGLNRVCALVRPSHIKDCKTSDLSTVYSFHFSVSAELLPSLVLTARTVHATNL